MPQRIVGWQACSKPFTHNFNEAGRKKACCQRDAAKNSKSLKPFVRLCFIVYFLNSAHGNWLDDIRLNVFGEALHSSKQLIKEYAATIDSFFLE
jgi:hypothetical protein